MNNSDELRYFVNPGHGWKEQLLGATLEDRDYAFELIHITLNERSKRARHPMEHVHDVYHVVLFTEGGSEVSLLGQATPVQAGTLVTVSPGESHTFGALKPTPFRYHEITFKLTHGSHVLTVPFVDYLTTLTGISCPRMPNAIQIDSRTLESMTRRFTRIWDCVESGSPTVEASLEIASLLVEVARWLSADHAVDATPQSRLIDVKRYLDTHFAANDSVEELAEMAYLSRGHFLREFKRAVGVPPVQYRLGLRMEAAKSLLCTSNLKCREISERLGFGDEFHFSRTFKRLVGVSPSRYRESGDGKV